MPKNKKPSKSNHKNLIVIIAILLAAIGYVGYKKLITSSGIYEIKTPYAPVDLQEDVKVERNIQVERKTQPNPKQEKINAIKTDIEKNTTSVYKPSIFTKIEKKYSTIKNKLGK